MNNEQKTAGYRVIDPEGGTHEYPNAYGVHVDRCDLYLNDENNKTIVIFHRWEHVERINPPATPALVMTVNVAEQDPAFIARLQRLAI